MLSGIERGCPPMSEGVAHSASVERMTVAGVGVASPNLQNGGPMSAKPVPRTCTTVDLDVPYGTPCGNMASTVGISFGSKSVNCFGYERTPVFEMRWKLTSATHSSTCGEIQRTVSSSMKVAGDMASGHPLGLDSRQNCCGTIRSDRRWLGITRALGAEAPSVSKSLRSSSAGTIAPHAPEGSARRGSGSGRAASSGTAVRTVGASANVRAAEASSNRRRPHIGCVLDPRTYAPREPASTSCPCSRYCRATCAGSSSTSG
mmetsp:Transcript_15298/g.46624  ORF Transcript_15298/g.46624 Transcript_15298/m.46624 type:complete len:260 (-) Transcript_15298:1200-1979(-)